MLEPPEDMNLRTHTNAPTTIADLPSPVNVPVSPTARSQSQSKFNVTARSMATSADAPSFPYLAAMIQKANGHTSKKVVFDRSDYDDLLGQIIEQREMKKHKEAQEKINSKKEEAKLLEHQRELMVEER